MHHTMISGRGRIAFVLLLLFFVSLIAFPSLLAASESCSMLGGKCRDVCGGNERAEAGDFEDCGAKQECCAVYVETPVQCCIASLDAKNFGPANCGPPVNGACPKGSGSPAPCLKLQMCATPK
jgi:hypothetical protein